MLESEAWAFRDLKGLFVKTDLIILNSAHV